MRNENGSHKGCHYIFIDGSYKSCRYMMLRPQLFGRNLNPPRFSLLPIRASSVGTLCAGARGCWSVASRTTVRLTECSRMMSDSVGSFAPGLKRPLRICSENALTTSSVRLRGRFLGEALEVVVIVVLYKDI